MYRLGTIVIAAAVALAACGGGGGGDDKKPDGTLPGSGSETPITGGGPSQPSTEVPVTPTEVPGLDTVRPDASVITDSMSYALSLGASGRSVPRQAALDLGISAMGGTYELDFKSGTFDGDRFSSDLRLPSAKLRLSASARNGTALQGLSVTQYEGSIATPGSTAYAASVQVLTEAGIGTVGIGQWKYLGEQQYGYFSGKRHVRGAFMFGTPATSSQATAMPSGAFSGYMQGGAEAYYIDIFDQVTANASAYYDAATKTVTVRFSQLNYWNSTFGTDGRMNIRWDAPRASSLLLDGMTCSGAVSTDGTFSCRFRTVLSGEVKGQVFGPQGQILAGTFALSGWLVTPGSDGLVGGFIVQRPTARAPAVTTGQTPWTVTPGNIVMNDYPVIPVPMTVIAQAPSSQVKPVYAAVLDASGTVNPDVKLTQNGQQYEVVFYTNSSPRAEVRSGEVLLRLCHDDPLVCREPVAGSPWRIPYRVNGLPYPGPNPQISTLTGTVFEGQSLVQWPTLTLNEAVVYPGSPMEQYKVKITDAGVFTNLGNEYFWYAKEPSGIYKPGLSFVLKDNLPAGLYTGTVKLSVCGYSGFATECLPVERSQIEIPYQIRVNGWTDIRPLQTVPETQALVNRRGNAQERMNLPVTVDPSNISARWKTPFIGNYGAYGLGDGFVFGYSYRGNDVNGRDWQRLDVLRESDGQRVWGADFTDTLSNESVSGSNFRVMASNNRLFVRIGRTNSGSFTLKVFEALTGRLTAERQCVNCSLYWEHTYGHGWAGQTYNAGTQELQLLLYDARTDEFIAMPARRASSSELNDAETAKIREVFFAGQALPIYATHPDGTAASTNNLNILAGEQGVSLQDKISGRTVWSTTYPGEIVGISNSGVLYLKLKLGQTADQWPLVAVNLMKW